MNINRNIYKLYFKIGYILFEIKTTNYRLWNVTNYKEPIINNSNKVIDNNFDKIILIIRQMKFYKVYVYMIIIFDEIV